MYELYECDACMQSSVLQECLRAVAKNAELLVGDEDEHSKDIS